MDDDDPILKTIPIQFSSSNVSLLQFPTISKPFSANELPVAARMKMGRMLLDFKLPQHSSAERAAQLKLSTMQYESKIVAMQNNYFAAILDNDQLHLTSVDSILQFRPNLSFIDQNAASQNPKDPADTQDEGKVVQVVARASDPELERKSAVANMRKLMDEEPWLDYQIVSMDSSLAQQKLKDLSASCDMETDQQTHSADDYLDLIHPRLINNQSQDSDKPTELSLAQIMTLSPQDQIKNILINAQVIDLETLERLTNLDRASIVTFALDYSMIVGGRFIVSSELIYDDHQPLLKHARTYAIYLFLIKQFVSVKEIVSMSTLLPEMAKSMLQDIARPSSNGWKLKIEAISSFEEDYGDISKQQLALVEKAGICALEYFNVRKQNKIPSTSRTTTTASSVANVEAPENEIDISHIPIKGETEDNQIAEFCKALLQRGPTTTREVLNALQARKTDPRPENRIKMITMNTDNILPVLKKDGIFLRNKWISKGEPGTILDTVRNTVIGLFNVQEKVKKADVMTACQEHHGTVPSAAIYSKVMQELATSKGMVMFFVPGVMGSIANDCATVKTAMMAMGATEQQIEQWGLNLQNCCHSTRWITCNEKGISNLYFHRKMFHGAIPESLGSLAELEGLTLTRCGLSGQIPESLGNLLNLKRLSLGRNKLVGTIPLSLSKLAKLENLHLYANQLTGELPEFVTKLPKLQKIWLFGNKLSGAIPSAIGDLKDLQELYISGNEFGGLIPESVGRLEHLTMLYLYQNKLSGPIPASLGNLQKLEWLGLQENQLSGQIPSSLGNLIKLDSMDLSDNLLTGVIPDSFGKLESLKEIDLRGNDLSGEVPESMSKLECLKECHLPKSLCTRNQKDVPEACGEFHQCREKVDLQLQ